MNDSAQKFKELLGQVEQAMDQLGLAERSHDLLRLEEAMQAPDFWDNPKAAAETSQQYAQLKQLVSDWEKLQKNLRENLELALLDDPKLSDELAAQYNELKKAYDSRELELKLSGEHDAAPALLHIHAGTGGTDAQDWAQMLLRMYLRWAEKSGYTTEILDESAGEEAGIKSVIIRFEGPFAYGKLKSEHGVHRLVRLSPFNADNLRQTSFALVEVIPEITSDEMVQIDEKDIRVDVFRSGGAGGQSVNTTDSAVRVTHLPTGITVSIQNERSQTQNRETAMKVLRSRLVKLKEEQQKEKIEELKGVSATEQWGQQIRNYVLHPYSLVKDTRTGLETSDTEAVLNGDIDGFIDAYLRSRIGTAQSGG